MFTSSCFFYFNTEYTVRNFSLHYIHNAIAFSNTAKYMMQSETKNVQPVFFQATPTIHATLETICIFSFKEQGSNYHESHFLKHNQKMKNC